MRLLRSLGLLFLLALVACSDRRREAEALVRKSGPEPIRADAARLYKDVFAARSPDFVSVKPAHCPASVQQFAPIHVGAYADGIVLALERKGDSEAGLYIVPLHMERTPAAPPYGTLERIEEGIYWYSFSR